MRHEAWTQETLPEARGLGWPPQGATVRQKSHRKPTLSSAKLPLLSSSTQLCLFFCAHSRNCWATSGSNPACLLQARLSSGCTSARRLHSDSVNSMGAAWIGMGCTSGQQIEADAAAQCRACPVLPGQTSLCAHRHDGICNQRDRCW